MMVHGHVDPGGWHHWLPRCSWADAWAQSSIILSMTGNISAELTVHSHLLYSFIIFYGLNSLVFFQISLCSDSRCWNMLLNSRGLLHWGEIGEGIWVCDSLWLSNCSSSLKILKWGRVSWCIVEYFSFPEGSRATHVAAWRYNKTNENCPLVN